MKRFFTDFSELPKHLFFKKYFLLPGIILLSWVGLCLVVDMIMNRPGNLKTIKGIVQYASVRVTNGRKPKYQLNLSIYGRSTVYTKQVNPAEGDYILQHLHEGDLVDIHVPKHYYPGLTLGYITNIYELSVDNRLLINSKNNIRNNQISLTIVTAALVIFFSIHSRRNKNKQALDNQEEVASA